MIRPSVLIKVWFLPSCRDLEIRGPVFMITFQRASPPPANPRERHSWVVKLPRDWEKIYVSKGKRKHFKMASFLK